MARGEGGTPPGGAAPVVPASTTPVRPYIRRFPARRPPAGPARDLWRGPRPEQLANGGRMARNHRLDCAWSRLPRPRHRVWRRRTCAAPCRHHGAQVLGIDHNADAIASANAIAGREGLRSLATFQQADATLALPVPDASIDATICIDAINHLPGRLDALREWRRVLKAGGSPCSPIQSWSTA
jgi:SAM-dependent methyltransferase